VTNCHNSTGDLEVSSNWNLNCNVTLPCLIKSKGSIDNGPTLWLSCSSPDLLFGPECIWLVFKSSFLNIMTCTMWDWDSKCCCNHLLDSWCNWIFTWSYWHPVEVVLQEQEEAEKDLFFSWELVPYPVVSGTLWLLLHHLQFCCCKHLENFSGGTCTGKVGRW